MKHDSFINLFWSVVWSAVLVFAIVGIFWKPAIFFVAAVSAVMFGMFLHDLIKYRGL